MKSGSYIQLSAEEVIRRCDNFLRHRDKLVAKKKETILAKEMAAVNKFRKFFFLRPRTEAEVKKDLETNMAIPNDYLWASTILCEEEEIAHRLRHAASAILHGEQVFVDINDLYAIRLR